MIKEISNEEFKNYAYNNPLGNFHQTLEYALLKAEDGYDYEFIAYIENNTILGASLILTKKIGNTYYGYAPRGFILDYSNTYLLRNFTNEVKEYYKQKGYAFIKINPEIAIGSLNKKTLNMDYNVNYSIVNNLINTRYKKLKNNMYFESLLPRINTIIPLNNFNIYSLEKNCRNKIRKALRKGLVLEKSDYTKLDIIFNFIKNKRIVNDYYYNDLYNIFSKNDNIDLFLVKIDYKTFLINSQNSYNEELKKNNYLSEELTYSNQNDLINKKMNSDKVLLAYKNDIAEASKYINENKDVYIAGALVIKYQNRITIEISGYDKDYKRFVPNYFLYYAILDYYKNNYNYADLNGITADMSKNSPYYGLNQFKLGFNPKVYEYIGEFDLIINEQVYNNLLKNGLLAKEFNK